MTALLSTQDQSQSGDTPQSILFNQVGGGQDIVRQTNGRDLPGAVAASGTDTSAGGTSGPAGAVQSATDASGATVQTETNADGSITTVTTYADGSTSTSTTAALTDGDGTSDTGSGKSANAKLAAQWTQLQSQLLSAATSTLSLLV
jgi:YD repeat-containing protein